METFNIRNIFGYEGYYQIADNGNVFSCEREIKIKSRKGKDFFIKYKAKKMKLHLGNNGYKYIMFSKDNHQKVYLVHRLVAIAFISNPENKPEVNHIDGNKSNNNVLNLEWVNKSENSKHAFRMGFINQSGENNGDSKLTKKQVVTIKEMISQKKIIQKDIARIFNVSEENICAIKKGRSWSFI